MIVVVVVTVHSSPGQLYQKSLLLISRQPRGGLEDDSAHPSLTAGKSACDRSVNSALHTNDGALKKLKSVILKQSPPNYSLRSLEDYGLRLWQAKNLMCQVSTGHRSP